MNSKELAANLRAGRRAYGTLIVSPSPRWPEAVAGLGLDFVFIDTEHIALDRAQLSWMCQTYRAVGLPPIVRIPSPDPYLACMALDGGAAGIVAPYVETVEQVQALRGAVKFRPLKGERLALALHQPESLEPELIAYLQNNNRDSLLIINIESRPALDRLDELLDVPDVDAVLIGPHDLSCSLGVPEQYDYPRFEEAVIDIIRRARARGVAAGIHSWMEHGRYAAWVAAGLNLIICKADIIAMRELLGKAVGELRASLGDSKQVDAVTENI
jgi:2-keto-3-deoxy-L-rhamnonate aldolase RhmA